MRPPQILQILRLSRPPPLPPAPRKIKSKVDQESVSKKKPTNLPKWSQQTPIRTHMGERFFHCTHSGCGKAFANPSNLTRRMRDKHGERQRHKFALGEKVSGKWKGDWYAAITIAHQSQGRCKIEWASNGSYTSLMSKSALKRPG